ncbi:NTP transferase domain-containing protein [Acinetobacter haemolyticus]|uniref:molybdenum cofactor guanylyltransferase n=1 Tax=Acinetobacter haemolyticus TaxID=29430 RepID=UPI0013726AF6|nr:molybdenum cofactor guanylyltransferase [Acinetobacter haemolyticus]NAR28611.1 NTP transferase domain-containing protein [Acinetobacter haemolyticus]NAR62389.1 NTP transferase domain-containing protein [Acinetobacter haemolyticus]
MLNTANITTHTLPKTDLVILAGGQASRMQGQNKLLMHFDEKNQLLKIIDALADHVQQVWVNSHRDLDLYRSLNTELKFFKDDEVGFLGPLIGMQSAWRHCAQDNVLFIPCDVTQIPQDILLKMHKRLAQSALCQVVYLEFNQQALYPFCLMRRHAVHTIQQQIKQHQLRLSDCFKQLHAQALAVENPATHFHSINSLHELQQYQAEQQWAFSLKA